MPTKKTPADIAQTFGTFRPDDRTATLISDRMTAAAGTQTDKIKALLQQGVIAPGPGFNRLK